MADADMPPPPKRKLNTNADFRKLLETPRVDRGGDAPGERKTKKNQTPQSGQPKKKPHRPKPEPTKKEEDESGYRDRAEERRKGFNPDYERVNADLASLVAGNSTVDPDLNNISVEDSKFLGGDVDHTHLVKGLDYALLQKVRGEMVKEDDDDEPDAKSRAKAPREREVVKFTSAAGRAVFNAVFERPKIRPSELFLPGRTAFVFDLEEDISSDIPTTLRRSKADCPPVTDSMLGSVDSSVLERMAKIMSYMRVSAGGKHGKIKKKEKLRMLQAMDSIAVNGTAKPPPAADAPAERPSAPADAEEDIFGDAGRDFVPELPRKAAYAKDMEIDALPPPPPPLPDAAVGPARPPTAASYEAYPEAPPPPPPLPAGAKADDDEDAELDQLAGLAPKPPPPPEEPTQDREAPTLRRREKEKVKEAIPKDTEDAYEELYPDYQGYSGVLADSDEEDLTHMDGKDGASRYDFETEEQWQAHKSSKEMMPKAAFQFGVKAADGRKGQKALVRHREQKESNQLNKIQNLLEKKHGSDYAGAFREPAAEPAGGSSKAAAKRRRI